MDLKRVNRIGQTYKDIVFGFIRRLQHQYPSDNPFFIADDLIKHTILLYFVTKLIESSILTEDEHDEFLNFLSQNNKPIVDYPLKLIYDCPQKHKKGAYTFAKKIWDVANILILIEIMGKVVIGGYTKVGWKADKYSGLNHKDDTEWDADKDAFVFFWRSSDDRDPQNPYICNIKQDQESISHALGYSQSEYCRLGSSFVFYNGNCLCQFQHKEDTNYFEAYPHDNGWLTGGMYNYIWDYKMEIFQIEQ